MVLRADCGMRMEKNSFRGVRYQLDDKMEDCKILSSVFFPQSVFICLCMVVRTAIIYLYSINVWFYDVWYVYCAVRTDSLTII
jgi:hypothetical protein